MRGPTAALLWELWRQHRMTIAVIAGLTVVGRLFDVLEEDGQAGGIVDTPILTELLGMVAFLLLFTVFNHTDSSAGRGVGLFPRRFFTLPVSSLRLVAVPVVAGIVAIELLYLAWMEPFTRGGSTSRLFIAVLFAAFIV